MEEGVVPPLQIAQPRKVVTGQGRPPTGPLWDIGAESKAESKALVGVRVLTLGSVTAPPVLPPRCSGGKASG